MIDWKDLHKKEQDNKIIEFITDIDDAKDLLEHIMYDTQDRIDATFKDRYIRLLIMLLVYLGIQLIFLPFIRNELGLDIYYNIFSSLTIIYVAIIIEELLSVMNARDVTLSFAQEQANFTGYHSNNAIIRRANQIIQTYNVRTYYKSRQVEKRTTPTVYSNRDKRVSWIRRYGSPLLLLLAFFMSARSFPQAVLVIMGIYLLCAIYVNYGDRKYQEDLLDRIYRGCE